MASRRTCGVAGERGGGFAWWVWVCFWLVGSVHGAETTSQGIYCVDARHLGFGSRLLLDSLQALANSNAPVLFVLQRGEDDSWRGAMETALGKRFEEGTEAGALTRFGASAPQVICDARQHWQVSIATTLAGVNGALLTDHELKGHEIVFDCRDRWTNKVEAYRWAVAELLPKCPHNQLVYLDERVTCLRDYAMQQKLFVLNLDPLNDAQEIRLLEEILGRFGTQTRVFGWASGEYARKAKGQDGVSVEVALVRRLSRRGLMLVPADFAANLSFYSQTEAAAGMLCQKRVDRGLRFQPGKRYVLLVVSDGDNLQYDLGAMRAHWKQARPEVPVAWSISPQWAEVGSAILQTYYREAAERGGWDEFVAGPSGYAYVNPGDMSAPSLGLFVAATRRACQAADIKSIVILDDGGRAPQKVSAFLNAYAGGGFDGLWLAAMPNYVGTMRKTAFLSERFRLGRDNAAEIVQRVKQLKVSDPFVMVYVDGWANVGDTVREFAAGLDESCTVVSATEMASLIRQSIVGNANAKK